MEQRREETCHGSGGMCEVVAKKRIGRGGNSEVYLGVLQGESKFCVVKRAIRGKNALLQLENEWRVLRYLKNAGYKYSPEPLSFSEREMVMEYLGGFTLEHADLGESSEDELKALFTDICKITGALHELRIPVIHRDIKPSNIMTSKEGKLYLIDFGTAAIYAGYKREEAMENSGITGAGTKGYAAPEQYGGLSPECFATDIYQLGRTMEVLLSRSNASDAFRDEMCRVIKRCCAPVAGERYSRVSDIPADLLMIKTRKKKKSILVKLFGREKPGKDEGYFTQKPHEPELFVDIVRTFDTIEFL
ncbi:serine/threonine protein kinase [Butyrivibrio sp. AD3002]|uniref:serine/threonine protein kinase n=1 Tax=Butyrivibrio sp. AD3002 TaxID=1280670 RepID=UPI0009DC155B|nr:RIO1 family regulatory kinase/ATPase [Butyrivibrio sp. AD3002]